MSFSSFVPFTQVYGINTLSLYVEHTSDSIVSPKQGTQAVRMLRSMWHNVISLIFNKKKKAGQGHARQLNRNVFTSFSICTKKVPNSKL